MHGEEVAQRTVSIVYIEADPSNAFLMQALLNGRSGYAMHHVDAGSSGLALCRSVRPDLVITAMRLPDLSAYEFLDVLRSDATTQDIPCIVLSGDARPSEIERALAAGFNDYWTKPVDVRQVLTRIDEHVAARQSAGVDGVPSSWRNTDP